MNVSRKHRSDFRLIGESLFQELINALAAGKHVALLGPRNCGKAIIIEEIVARTANIPAAHQPDVVRLIWDDFRRATINDLLRGVARQLGAEPPLLVTGARARTELMRLYKERIRRTQRPLWIFIQDILGFPTLCARELLTSLSLSETDPILAGRHAALVTGSAGFAPLTYSSVSPYRHAERFIIAGMEKDYAEHFIVSRRLHRTVVQRSTPTERRSLLDRDAFQYLYAETGGQAFLMQEAIVACARHPFASKYVGLNVQWRVHHVREILENFLRYSMPFDYFVNLLLSDVEHSRRDFDLLLRVMRGGDGKVKVESPFPHRLEIAGLLHRRNKGCYAISSPLWRHFLQSWYSRRCVADVYATQHRWPDAWRMYRMMPASSADRPVAGVSQSRLDNVFGHFQDSLAEHATRGTQAVVDHLIRGATYLLGFDRLVLFDRVTGAVLCSRGEVPAHIDFSQWPKHGRDLDECPPLYDALVTGDRLHLWTTLKQPLALRPTSFPALYLGRSELSRVIDSEEQSRIRRLLAAFWQAYMTADEIDYRKSIGDLREKHINVLRHITEIQGAHDHDFGIVVKRTADALVHLAGYYRVLICLVDAKREFIQAVSSCCRDKSMDFDYATNFPLRSRPHKRPDIQQYVVWKKALQVVPDAVHPQARTFTTQTRHCRRLGMKAITVVPMTVHGKVIGTVHLERDDKSVPTVPERALFQSLADQLAVLFVQAERESLLLQAVLCLSDSVRIVSPTKRLTFLNASAAGQLGTAEMQIGWQDKPGLCACVQPGGTTCLIPEVEKIDGAVHHYELIPPARGGPIARDIQMVPIDDFRRDQLRPAFHGANGRIGYVERIHDLTPFYELLVKLQEWFADVDLASVAAKVLTYFHERSFEWCRIYAIPSSRSDCLVSLAQFGLRDPRKAAAFQRGGIIFSSHGEGGQPWHVLNVPRDLVVYRYDPRLPKDSIRPVQDPRGFPTYSTNDVRNRKELEKEKTNEWIEAPLKVGTRDIGKISLSVPANLRPEMWELTRSAVLGAAVALYNAVRHEQSARLAADAAFKLAADQVIHQLANTIGPLESRIRYALDDLRSDPNAARQELAKAEIGARKARGIVADFKRYASPQPFDDIEEHRTDEFLRGMVQRLRREFADVRIGLRSPLPRSTVRVSWKGMAEVFEVLVRNSIMHSGIELPRLHLTVSAKARRNRQIGDKHIDRVITICYKDNGCGVDEERKQEIFLRFKSTHPEGTGLGLVIARDNIEKQDGIIAEVGIPGKGVCFTITLPAAERTRESRHVR